MPSKADPGEGALAPQGGLEGKLPMGVLTRVEIQACLAGGVEAPTGRSESNKSTVTFRSGRKTASINCRMLPEVRRIKH